jgi:putative phosphoserine phosphatase/1-acylglycerol-3-phosphate O-acyltransferase
MRAEGLFDGRRSLPGESLSTGSTTSRARASPSWPWCGPPRGFTKGWDVDAVCRAGERAAAELADLVQPYAPGVLAEHRAAGHLLVLATTSPVDLVAPFAELAGFDTWWPPGTRADGRYTGGIDGDFAWATGKLAAVRRWAGRPTSTWPGATPTPTASSTSLCSGPWAIPTP